MPDVRQRASDGNGRVNARATLFLVACALLQAASTAAQTPPLQLVIPFENKGEHDGKQAAKGDCAFTMLAYGAVPATDPALLLAAIAFILALGFTSLPAPTLRGSPYLRPPLRGPPARA